MLASLTGRLVTVTLADGVTVQGLLRGAVVRNRSLTVSLAQVEGGGFERGASAVFPAHSIASVRLNVNGGRC